MLSISQEGKMTSKQAQKRKPSVAMVFGVIIVLLLILAVLYLGVFKGIGGLAGVTARTLTSINLRAGPGTSYPKAGGVPANTEVTVVGRNEDGSWLVVETESGEAWMTGSPEYIEIDAGALARLPVVEAPPLSYDASNVHVNQVLNQIPLVVHHPDHVTCASHAGLNNLLSSVADGNVIGPHSGDFAFVGMDGNVLFEYSGGTLRLIRDNPIARFEGGEKVLSLEEALRMFETGDIVWTGSFGEWPARGVPGCDESAKPG
jgi:hypothetical protein